MAVIREIRALKIHVYIIYYCTDWIRTSIRMCRRAGLTSPRTDEWAISGCMYKTLWRLSGVLAYLCTVVQFAALDRTMFAFGDRNCLHYTIYCISHWWIKVQHWMEHCIVQINNRLSSRRKGAVSTKAYHRFLATSDHDGYCGHPWLTPCKIKITTTWCLMSCVSAFMLLLLCVVSVCLANQSLSHLFCFLSNDAGWPHIVSVVDFDHHTTFLLSYQNIICPR